MAHLQEVAADVMYRDIIKPETELQVDNCLIVKKEIVKEEHLDDLFPATKDASVLIQLKAEPELQTLGHFLECPPDKPEESPYHLAEVMESNSDVSANTDLELDSEEDLSESESSEDQVKLTNPRIRRKLKKNKHQPSYNCGECHYNTWKKSRLIRHSRTHTGEKPYMCATCDYCAATVCRIREHVKTHALVKPLLYSCELTPSLLKKRKTSRANSKLFKCKLCDFSCLLKYALKRHEYTHIDKNLRENLFQCETCSFTASEKRTLRLHIMSVHMGTKPFECGSCDYRAVKKSDVLRHTRRHTGIKPYKCDICSYSASRKNCLLLHITKKHANNGKSDSTKVTRQNNVTNSVKTKNKNTLPFKSTTRSTKRNC